ncbi:phage terminase large subunit-like protein [Azospirillum lipoferum]|uniref:Terminase large subunit n=1 Tax=Azospirillum lipoferum TaxID=193 RepID=A0A5A9GEY1_AZOLI|nr:MULTISPECIES: terminase large subunit [Azospirillum]KAA0592956.1 terminase large subunit [Azospirillum lipoferum]MCP1613987.1 phage terminase large subunit-like protein [Azospirillum lipoferum]MDW5537621.1 terminase large subunit [Azospirillum sp. NL1]
MRWTTACPDWERRIIAGESLIPCPPLFSAEAEAALKIFRALKIVDVPGSPTFEEACREWVFDFVGAVFGAYDAETGRRLINEFLLLISKKNSKSTIAAGIMVTALLRNWRQNAEFIIIAPTIKVAQNSADPAMSMVTADPELFEILKPIPHLRMVEHRTTGATLKILAADSDVVTGNKATGVLIDELHLFGTKANAEAMLREARGGLTSRPEGFVIALSTQGEEPPAGVFKQWLARFRDIRDGKLSAPKSLGVLYEFPKAMLEAKAHLRPENFYVTNPNMGASVDEEFLLDEYAKAQLGGEGSVRGFLSKHLNVEVGLNMGSDRWAGADFWEGCGEEGLTLEAILARCEVVVVGIDGGGLDDLLGLAVLGRCRETRRWLMWHRAWAHRIVLERRQEIAPRLLDFEKDGDLTIVDDPAQAVTELADIVMQVEQAELLAEQGIGVDAAGIGEIVDELTGRGIALERIIGISQGWKLNGAIKTAERRLASKTTAHGGRPMMAWCVGNARIVQQGNAISITKQVSGTAKIDPLMSSFNAVALMATNPAACGPSVYTTRGLLIV